MTDARVVLEVRVSPAPGTGVEEAIRELVRWVKALPATDDMARVESVVVVGRDPGHDPSLSPHQQPTSNWPPDA